MTERNRIALNVVATFVRNIYQLACGLFAGRWAYLALGQVDYGLMGLVGGLIVFVGFITSRLSGSVYRFYAFSIGEERTDYEKGLENSRKWFNAALTIHIVLPVVSVIIGYPIAVYVIRNFLTIPPDRVEACVWVFRFVCLSSFVSMVSVPSNAFYNAKQYVAELTVYSLAATTANVLFMYYMVTHPGVWLVRYQAWTCFVTVGPSVIILCRAYYLFPECRIKRKYLLDWTSIRRLGSFAGWTMVSSVANLLRGQGLAIFVNKYFGPIFNTSMSVATNVSSKTDMFSNSMIPAFAPAITNACGEGDDDKMRALSYRFCKISTLMLMPFVIPVALELPYLLELWLKNPPPGVNGICWCVMVATLLRFVSVGHHCAVMSKEKIALYQLICGFCGIIVLPLAWILVSWDQRFVYIGLAIVLSAVFDAIGKVYMAKLTASMSIRYWLFKVAGPLMFVFVLMVCGGLVPQLLMPTCFVRVMITGAVAEFLFLFACWVVLDASEKQFLLSKISSVFARMKRKV